MRDETSDEKPAGAGIQAGEAAGTPAATGGGRNAGSPTDSTNPQGEAVPAAGAGVPDTAEPSVPADDSGRHGVRMAAFRAAAPLTVPICLGFLFLGASYGILMATKGFSFLWPMFMALFIFAGSMEFVTVNLLLSAFNPFAAFALALMVNARHLFYGLSMLGRFKGLGWKRPFLIYGMCDETFALNVSARVPAGVDRGWFYLWVTWLNQAYWMAGATLGGLIGAHLPFSSEGLDFVLTALFAVIFLDQWLGAGAGRLGRPGRVAGVIGVLVSVAALALLGPDAFMVPAMAVMLALFLVLRPWLDNARKGKKR